MNGQLQRAFLDGYLQGIATFAWWKDGVQYVGTTGKTLKEAVAEAERRFPIVGETPKGGTS